jgi:periplasmic protein CpxP/Spy
MMKLSSKHLLLTTLMATCGFAAIAQNTTPTPTAPAAGAHQMQRGEHSSMRERMFGNHQERMAKRQAELKAKLKITPAQEGAWTTFTAAMQPPANMGKGMMGMRHDPKVKAEMDKLTTPERIDKMQAMRAERMKTMSAEMDKRGAATKAFYAVLSSEQKAVFDAVAMHGGRHGMGMGGEHGERGGKGGHDGRGEHGRMGHHS